jgi:hypothetical protein
MNIKIDSQFILDLFISGILVLFSMAVIGLVVPDGLVTKFLIRGSKIVGLISLVLGAMFLIFLFLNKNFRFKKKINLPELKDFLLLALPMSPIVDYAIINSEYLNTAGLLYLIGITLVFSFFLSFIFPILFSYFASLQILMIVGLALSFTILSMAKISNNPNAHLLNSQFVTQGAYLAITFACLYLLYSFNKGIAYISVVFFMITGIVINFLNYSSNNSTESLKQYPDKLIKFLDNKDNKIINKKNIYILVYESYAGMETLHHYGFDNTKQMKFLEKNGFKTYSGIYSNGSVSTATTSRILELEGKLSQHVRHYTSGNAFALDVLKNNSYKTIGLFKSSYFFGSSPIGWDEYHPKGDVTKLGGKTITKAIFEGEFRFDIFEDDYDYKKYLELKKDYLSSNKKDTFFYTHNAYPGHSQNSGKCLPNEKKSYFKRMKKANIEMKNDVSNIKINDPNSIIVLLSDHGPYLTKNCAKLGSVDINTIDKYDIQDRYGTFLSIHWPKDILNVENNIVITQDIFPAILSRITNNRNLFDELKVERKFFDRFKSNAGGINVYNGIIKGGKDDGKALFDNRSYNLPK